MMHRFKGLSTFVVFVAAAMSAYAQDFPKVEVAVGYSLVRLSTTGFLEKFTQQGGSANAAYNFNRNLGLVFDMGGYNNNNIRGFNVDNTMFTYLVGPRFTARGDRISLFGNALLGGAHISGTAASNFGPPSASQLPTTVNQIEESNNSLAFLIGGGLDIGVSKHFAVRPAQFDYLLTRFNPGSQSETQNNLRYSAMMVFRF